MFIIFGASQKLKTLRKLIEIMDNGEMDRDRIGAIKIFFDLFGIEKESTDNDDKYTDILKKLLELK